MLSFLSMIGAVTLGIVVLTALAKWSLAIFRWFDERTSVSAVWRVVAGHLVPPGVGWWYVFGSATLVAFILQVVTGIALATAYVASTGDAYHSLQFITHEALMGRLLRGIHYFGASAMVLFIGVHTCRVFLTGSYKFPREVNWLTGAFLLLFTLIMAFTGQLLRWDQTAVWSVIVGAEQAGRVPLIGDWVARFVLAGDTVGGATLSRFFAFHVFFVPAMIFAFLGAHLYLVVRNGISEPPKAGRLVDPRTYRAWYENLVKREGRPFWPDAAWRDVVFGVGVVAVVFSLAVLVGPPELAKPPDPSNLNAYPRPDWYFLWYFAVLALIPPSIETYVIVFGPLLFGVLLLVLPFLSNRGERSPLRRPWSMAIVLAAVVSIATLWREGEKAPWSPDFSARPVPAHLIEPAGEQAIRGAQLFYDKGCEFCHSVEDRGGHRGPDLTNVAERLSAADMTIRIMNGGINMPAFAPSLSPSQLDDLLAFLKLRHRPRHLVE